MANSSVSMGGRTGLLVSLICTVPLMMVLQRLFGWQSDTWRAVFVLYGSLGLAWGAAFLWLYRDAPRQHPWCNDAEVALIEGVGQGGQPAGGQTAPVADWAVGLFCTLYFLVNIGWILLVGNAPGFVLGHVGQPLGKLLGSPFQASALVGLVVSLVGLCGTLLLGLVINRLLRRVGSPASRRMELPLDDMVRSKEVWLMCGINFLVNIGWIFLATWLPQYLIENHRQQLKSVLSDVVSSWLPTSLESAFGEESLIAALITAVVGVAAICGGLSGGRATDVLVRRFGRTWGRRLPGLCAGLLVCGMYLVVPQLTGLWLFVGMMIAIAFTIDFGLGATWASYQDIGGRHVASVLGCGNMCGNLGAAFFGKQIGALADRDQWNAVFYIAAAAMALASCCWLLFDASRPIVREEIVGQPQTDSVGRAA